MASWLGLHLAVARWTRHPGTRLALTRPPGSAAGSLELAGPDVARPDRSVGGCRYLVASPAHRCRYVRAGWPESNGLPFTGAAVFTAGRIPIR
jgi:hypothetical protein